MKIGFNLMLAAAFAPDQQRDVAHPQRARRRRQVGIVMPLLTAGSSPRSDLLVSLALRVAVRAQSTEHHR
jgi:hypothetical protein